MMKVRRFTDSPTQLAAERAEPELLYVSLSTTSDERKELLAELQTAFEEDMEDFPHLAELRKVLILAEEDWNALPRLARSEQPCPDQTEAPREVIEVNWG